MKFYPYLFEMSPRILISKCFSPLRKVRGDHFVFRKLFRMTLMFVGIFPSVVLAGNASSPLGEWKFEATGPNGGQVESVIRIVSKEGKLEGTINNRAGEAGLEEVKFIDGELSFVVEREFRRGLFRKFVFRTTYSGRVEDDVITGTVTVLNVKKEKEQSFPWKAHRTEPEN